MSNRVYIDEVSKGDLMGFHAYDDYDSCCAFNFENGTADDDLDFLRDIVTSDYGYPQEFEELLDFSYENEKGITIRGTFYDYEEWKNIWKDA